MRLQSALVLFPPGKRARLPSWCVCGPESTRDEMRKERTPNHLVSIPRYEWGTGELRRRAIKHSP